MSKFTEYLKLLPHALTNFEEIATGWLNVVRMELGNLPEDQLEEVARRRVICSQCPFMSENAKKGDYKSAREDEHCVLCSCPIKGKTANMASVCGAKYYNTTHPDKQPLEVKWVAYDSTEH